MRTLIEQAEAVARGDVSPVELVEEALEAIERTQPSLNAFTVVMAEDALERARRMEDEAPSGPLHGVPIAVKDLYDVRGLPTTGCCAAYTDRIASRDAAVVEALRDAGAIVVAKTNQHELAFGGTTQISSHGPAWNPWDHSRITGGSSGGSGVAVAARVVRMAMGSDTGGSVRVPASLCGVTGLKPTHGSVSLRGVMPLAPTLDTAGPLAADAADCRLVHDVLVGFDPDDPWSVDGRPLDAPETVERLRVAIPQSFLRLTHPDVRAAVERAAVELEVLGVVLDEIEGPDPDEAWEAIGFITPTEAAHYHPGLASDDRVHPGIRQLLEIGSQIPADAYLRGRDLQRKVRRDFEWALTAADAVLAPTTPFPAPTADTETVEIDGEKLEVARAGVLRLTAPVNLAGLPALSLPVGFSNDGIPVGAQLIGRRWSENVLCALGTAYQKATDHHRATPPG